MSEDQPRTVEPAAKQAESPEESRQRRSTAMIGTGGIALVWGLLALTAGSGVAWVLCLLGIGLLVGGLVIRR